MAIKKTTTPAAAAKPAAPSATTTLKAATTATAATTANDDAAKPAKNSVGRKELVQRVVDRTGMKPNQVKTAMDGILHEIGEVIAAGEMLAVQPLGKLVVNRKKDTAGADVYICKLRRRKPDAVKPPSPAATAAE